jgi:hypothetical protein
MQGSDKLVPPSASTSDQKTTGSPARPSRASKSPSPPRAPTRASDLAKEKSKLPSSPSSYAVYRVEEAGQPNRVFLFVETHQDEPGSGIVYQVTGDLKTGMKYERKKAKQPEKSPTYASKSRIGTISAAKLGDVHLNCLWVPAPEAQLKPDGHPMNPFAPIRGSDEWVSEVVKSLKTKCMLRS